NDNNHFVQWGVKYQNETINDELNEWERIDSAGYSLPYDPNQLILNSVLKSTNLLENNKLEVYAQDSYTYTKPESMELRVTGGIRGSYRGLSKEFLVSPRAEILFKPLGRKREIAFKLGGGLYYQPPFYREMRRLDGTVNTDLKSQKSVHIVGGLSYDFYWETISKKPFKLITEIYFKKLENLVSYEVDNVRIRYSGENDATGTAMGLDIRINGEFVPGAESWVNLSLLSVRESLNDVQHLRREIGAMESEEVDKVPRPTDRLMNLSMFFQDYLPSNKNFKMHVNFSVGTGLPFGLKDNNEVYRNTYRFKAYHRVDLGFAYQLWDSTWKDKKPRHPMRFTEKAWLSLEVFNLMDVLNQASNTWVKTITNQQFAIPNYLSSRRINLRVKFDF
ncbi:MAG TPA: TonB-dependent receptor, partial [Saprospirales bacterium]|nr:TonB-dependent receptor [Saprospirales bacterium]